MQANEVLYAMVGRRNLTTRAASRQLGRSDSYVSRMKNVPLGTETLAEIASKLDFELIIRDKITGEEIVLDPPEQD